MKKILLFFTVALLFNSVIKAQQPDPSVQLVHYVFNEFTPGIVKMKSGETFNQVLNYNTLTSEMIFDNNGKYLAIAEPENVDTVFISNRKFIPFDNKFYEVLVNSSMPLLLEYTATISEEGASTGYGNASTTTATTSYKSLVNSGGAYALKLPDGYKVIPKNTFLIMKNGKLEKAGSEKQLSKIFPDKKDMIKDLVKKNNINFSKREDVIELVKQIE